MARIVGGSPMGELRGKMGGFVFSRNTAGQYVRSYVVPVNPNTIAQTRARATFAQAAGTWHALDDSSKAQWNSFARTLFNPQRGANNGQFSGMNAFTALVNGQLQLNNFSAVPAVNLNGNPTPVAITAIASPMVYNVPPIDTLVAGISSGGYLPIDGDQAMLTFESAVIKENGRYEIFLDLSEPTDISEIKNAKDQKFGFAVFISEALEQANMFVQNPYLQLLKIVPPFEFDTTTTATTRIELTQNSGLNNADYRTRPSEGQLVRATVMAIGQDGQFAKIGAQMVEISSN